MSYRYLIVIRGGVVAHGPPGSGAAEKFQEGKSEETPRRQCFTQQFPAPASSHHEGQTLEEVSQADASV